MKTFKVKIDPPNDVHNWEDMMDPAKKDSEEHAEESLMNLRNLYKESIEILDQSNFMISISRKILP